MPPYLLLVTLYCFKLLAPWYTEDAFAFKCWKYSEIVTGVKGIGSEVLNASKISGEFTLLRGIRQGCVASLYFLKIRLNFSLHCGLYRFWKLSAPLPSLMAPYLIPCPLGASVLTFSIQSNLTPFPYFHVLSLWHFHSTFSI
jgi:hypothetical protein